MLDANARNRLALPGATPRCDQGILLSPTMLNGPGSSGVTPADFQETHIAELVLDVWVNSAHRLATGADLSPD